MEMISLPAFPSLSTERLVLRQLRDDDEFEIFTLRSDPRISAHLDRKLYESIDEARQFIDRINKGVATDDWAYWAVCLKEQDKLIGTICLWNFEPMEQRAELGYELLAEHQGKGIMREALKAVVNYGFGVLNLKEIQACPNPANARSINLLIKSNFIKGNGHNEDGTAVYSLIK